MPFNSARKHNLPADLSIETKILYARNAQIIPGHATLKYIIAIKCNDPQSTAMLREQIDLEGKKTRAKKNTIFIIQGNEHHFADRFPDILRILNQSNRNSTFIGALDERTPVHARMGQHKLKR